MVFATLFGCGPKKAEDAVKTSEQASASEVTKSNATEQKNDPQAYQDAFPILLKNLEGAEESLEDYKGKYVIINFWTTWCKYCIKEMPDLTTLQNENEDLVVLAVNVNEDHTTVEKFVKKNGITLKVLMDTDGAVSKTYGINSFPTTFFIDPSGKVIGYFQGMMSQEDMKSALAYLREQDTTKRD